MSDMERTNDKPIKVYVAVAVDFDEEGDMMPRELTWEDGTRYIIDKILDKRPAAALRAGGQGDRYTIVVEGRRSYLFFEKDPDVATDHPGRWFVERKVRH